MKKIILMACAILSLCSCSQTNEEKAKAIIEENLQKTMKDWSSYEFVGMTKLDSAKTSFLSTPEYDKLSKEKSDLELRKLKYEANSEYPDSIIMFSDKIAEIEGAIKEGELNHKREFAGWYTDFSFRGNNSLGAKVINKTRYRFDKDITKIEGTIDLN